MLGPSDSRKSFEDLQMSVNMVWLVLLQYIRVHPQPMGYLCLLSNGDAVVYISAYGSEGLHPESYKIRGIISLDQDRVGSKFDDS